MAKRRKGLTFYKKKKRLNASLVREIANYLFGIFASVFIAFAVVYAVGMTVSMVGVSMEPGLHSGQNVLINRYAYLFVKPKTGDVVAFLPKGNKNSHYYVKRVVACPGDTVQIIDGRLYVNGVMVEDTYDKMADAGIAAYPIILESNEYFVLGDNRNSSEDSRLANIGPVSGNDIAGKVWFHFASDTDSMGFVK